MGCPTVSVVLPTYNRSDVLSRAIDSVLTQDYDDFELLVVDDASTDDTEALVATYDDPRIEYISLDRNLGQAGARSVGIGLADGQYVAFQDSDDEWLPGKLSAQVREIKDAPPEVGIVYTGFMHIDGDSETYVPSERVGRLDGDVQQELLTNNFITTACALVRTRCLEEFGGFDGSLPRLQDWDLWLRLSREYEFRCIDRHLVNHYLQSDSVSRDFEELIEAKRRLLYKHDEQFETLPNDVLAVHYGRLGRFLLATGERHEARRHLRRAVEYDPSPRRVATYCLSHIPGLASVASI